MSDYFEIGPGDLFLERFVSAEVLDDPTSLGYFRKSLREALMKAATQRGVKLEKIMETTEREYAEYMDSVELKALAGSEPGYVRLFTVGRIGEPSRFGPPV